MVNFSPQLQSRFDVWPVQWRWLSVVLQLFLLQQEAQENRFFLVPCDQVSAYENCSVLLLLNSARTYFNSFLGCLEISTRNVLSVLAHCIYWTQELEATSLWMKTTMTPIRTIDVIIINNKKRLLMLLRHVLSLHEFCSQ